MTHSPVVLIASIAVLAGGCDGLRPLGPSGAGETCTLEIDVRFSPPDTTIQVGQGFQASVRLSSCGGKQQLNDVITWQSENPTVAIVDRSSGRVAGRRAGTTRILATGARYGGVGGLQVVVRAPVP